MIKYLHNNYPSAIYLYHYEVEAYDENEGRKKLIPVVRKCEHFAKSVHIHFHEDCFLCFDNHAAIRLVFQIKEPKDMILLKMSALLAFATVLKLEFINYDFFGPEN